MQKLKIVTFHHQVIVTIITDSIIFKGKILVKENHTFDF